MAKSFEHRIPMPAARRAGQGKGASAAPEKLLERFVRVVAFIERVGNAVGTLAFTWATVILLGGYSTVLTRGWFRDYWCAAVIFFIEAIRMSSRQNKLDYQVFFHTKGAFRRFGWDGVIVIVVFSNLLNYRIASVAGKKVPLAFDNLLFVRIVMLAVPPVIGMLTQLTLKLFPKWLLNFISIYSPLAAILLILPSIASFTTTNRTAKWIVFALVFLPVLLITRFPRISRLMDRALGAKKIFWRQLIVKLCMSAALVMLIFMPDNPLEWVIVLMYDIYAIVVVSFGNLQILAALARVALPVWRLAKHDYYSANADDRNLEPSLNIFYGMVLGQGLLYLGACLLEIFAFIPKKSLARRSGLRSKQEKEFINLYYAYAFEKSLEGDVLARKNVSLNSFAMDYCLNSDKPKIQLHGMRIMYSLLLKEDTRKKLFSELTNSTKTMARLIEMLDWSGPEDTTIRLFAAKVTSEIAISLRVKAVRRTVQVVSALLDNGNQHQRANPLLLNIDVEHEKIPDPILEGLDSAGQDTSNLLLETQEHSSQQGSTTEHHKPWIIRCLQCIFGSRSLPHEEHKQLTEQDLLPAIGMSILDDLVGCDQDNCLEINRASGLIHKIISFTSHGSRSSDTMYTETQRNVLMASSLKLLYSLTSIHGEIGVTLRHKVSKNPFLLRNLADVLGDNTKSQELKKLVAGILRNLAIDGEARQAIGHVQVLISRLVCAFLTPDGPSSTESDRLLRKVVGQALAMLATDNVNNCVIMVRVPPEYEFIKELTSMIHVDSYRCVAASLLQNLCRHARSELKEPDLKELSYSLREVLERIMDAESAELDILIGLSSLMSQVIPEDFARELKDGQVKKRFVKRLVDALDANMEPSADCPGIRRVILQQAISLMEYDPRYMSCFNDRGLKEALSMVEETISDVENYNLFLGDTGLIETSEPLSCLVVRAKQLLACHTEHQLA